MEPILNEIRNYGFLVEEMACDEARAYVCGNPDTGVGFILDATMENGRQMAELGKRYASLVEPCPSVVFLIAAHGREEEVAVWIEAGTLAGEHILIWDEEDEFEFFQKDLWSLLFSLGTAK